MKKFLLMLAVSVAFGAKAVSACDADTGHGCDNSPIVLISDTKSVF